MKTKPHVMVCDADAWTLRALQVALGSAGFQVHATRTAAEALDYAALRPLDIAITETVLPDSGGVELCRQLRKWRTAAVLILSSVTAEQEKVRALDAGADDFLTKPFRAGELVARLHAILRRTKPDGRQFQLQLNGLTFDPYTRVVYRNGVEVHLTPTEFEILRALAHNRGRALTLAELAQQTRGATQQPSHTTLCVHVSHLRRKLASAPEFPPIYTDPGIGYRLQGPNCERKPDPSEPLGPTSRGHRPRSPKPQSTSHRPIDDRDPQRIRTSDEELRRRPAPACHAVPAVTAQRHNRDGESHRSDNSGRSEMLASAASTPATKAATSMAGTSLPPLVRSGHEDDVTPSGVTQPPR